MSRPKTIRVHLSCGCGAKPHYRYGNSLEQLSTAVQRWLSEGHDRILSQQHDPKIEVETYHFARDEKLEARLRLLLVTKPSARPPTASEYLAKPGTVLRRYGS